MRAEQSFSTDEEHMIWSKAPEQVKKGALESTSAFRVRK